MEGDDLYDPEMARMGLYAGLYPQGTRRVKPGLVSLPDRNALALDPAKAEVDPETMSEEDLGDILNLGTLDEDALENARQMAVAEKLRDVAPPEGRSSGRVFTRANPLEHAGVLLQQYNARKDIEKLKTERRGIKEDVAKGKEGYAGLLRGWKKKLDTKVKMPKIDDSKYTGPGR